MVSVCTAAVLERLNTREAHLVYQMQTKHTSQRREEIVNTEDDFSARNAGEKGREIARVCSSLLREAILPSHDEKTCLQLTS